MLVWILVPFGAVLVLTIGYWSVSSGPLSDWARYDAARRQLRAALQPAGLVSESDLAGLPDPAKRLLRASGAIGRPVPTLFEARWRGRIRNGPDEPWMPLRALQTNHTRTPARYFWMDARRGGWPVKGLHVFEEGAASMKVRLLGVFVVARASGARATRSEMVTLLNDMAVLVPSALLQPNVEWGSVDDRRFRLVYTLGGNTVTAICTVDMNGLLVGFLSDDRSMLAPDGSFKKMGWGTPLRRHRRKGWFVVPTLGSASWHPDVGPPDPPYIELELEELRIDGDVPTR